LTYKLPPGSVGAGRSKGLLLFPDDPYLGGLHATFFYRDGKLFIRDENSVSGTFVRLQRPEPLIPGSLFAAGDRLFRYTGPVPVPPAVVPTQYGAPVPHVPVYTVEEILEGGRPGRASARLGPVIAIGRVGCDLSFPSDVTLQARHCEVIIEGGAAALSDVSGSEGTFVRLSAGAERMLSAGDAVRIGLQVLRLDAA
jgi:pSer/pThr/pTyr-binding forkhead associated (FHA) protein